MEEKTKAKHCLSCFIVLFFLIGGFLGLRATQVEFIQTQSLAKAAGASTAPSRQGKPVHFLCILKIAICSLA